MTFSDTFTFGNAATVAFDLSGGATGSGGDDLALSGPGLFRLSANGAVDLHTAVARFRLVENDGGDTTLTNSGADDIDLAGVSTEMSFTLVSDAGITDSDAIEVMGDVSFTVNDPGKHIMLDELDTPGMIRLNTSTGNATVTNAQAVVLGDSAVGGDLSAMAMEGGISDADGANVAVTGGAAFTTQESGMGIALGDAGVGQFDAGGPISAHTTGAGAHATIYNDSAATLGDSDVGGMLMVVAKAGDMTNAASVVGREGVHLAADQADAAIDNTAGTIGNGGTTAEVVLQADKLALAGGTISGGGGTVMLMPMTGGVDVQFVANGAGDAAAATLELGQDELDSVGTSGIVRIGGMTAGQISFDNEIDLSHTGGVHLMAGATVDDGAGGGVTAGQLAITAGTGVNFDNTTSSSVGTVAIANAAGDVTFVNDGTVNVGEVDGVVGIATDGQINLQTLNGGGLGLERQVNAGPASDVMLDIDGNVSGMSTGVVGGDDLIATVNGGATIYTDVNTIDLNTTAAGNVTIREADAVLLANIDTAAAGDGSIDVEVLNSPMTVQRVVAGAGDVRLKSPTTIDAVTNDGVEDVSGSVLSFIAGQSVGRSTPVEVNAADHLNANSAMVDIISVRPTGLVVGTVGYSTSLVHLTSVSTITGRYTDYLPDISGYSVSLTAQGADASNASVGTAPAWLEVLAPGVFNADASAAPNGDIYVLFIGKIPPGTVVGGNFTADNIVLSNVATGLSDPVTPNSEGAFDYTSLFVPDGSLLSPDSAVIASASDPLGAGPDGQPLPPRSPRDLRHVLDMPVDAFLALHQRQFDAYLAQIRRPSVLDPSGFDPMGYVLYLKSTAARGDDARAADAAAVLDGLRALGRSIRLNGLDAPGRTDDRRAALAPHCPAGMSPAQLDQAIQALAMLDQGA